MKKNNMKSIGILTGLWLLLFLNCGQRMAAQIRNKVCDTIPNDFLLYKLIRNGVANLIPDLRCHSL